MPGERALWSWKVTSVPDGPTVLVPTEPGCSWLPVGGFSAMPYAESAFLSELATSFFLATQMKGKVTTSQHGRVVPTHPLALQDAGDLWAKRTGDSGQLHIRFCAGHGWVAMSQHVHAERGLKALSVPPPRMQVDGLG